MGIDQLSRTWNDFGREDPLWAVLSNRDKRGNRWDVEEFFATGRAEIAGVIEQARARRADLPTGRALDFGSGVGRLSQALCEHFDHVDGVDVAPSMVEKARELNRFGERCEYHLNRKPDLGLFESGAFDFIYSNITLQHMEPDLAAGYLREFARLLSPGGLLVFQLPGERQRTGAGARPWLRPFADAAGAAKRFAYLLWHRTLRRRPIMDMFATPPERVREVLEAEDCRILECREDAGSAGPDWRSYVYWVERG